VTSTESKSTHKTELKMLIQNCGFCVRELLHGTLLSPKIWRCILSFWKICVFLFTGSPNLALRSHLYLHKNVSTNRPSF